MHFISHREFDYLMLLNPAFSYLFGHIGWATTISFDILNKLFFMVIGSSCLAAWNRFQYFVAVLVLAVILNFVMHFRTL